MPSGLQNQSKKRKVFSLEVAGKKKNRDSLVHPDFFVSIPSV